MAYTPKSFADALLQSLGAPTDPGNEAVIESWEAAEGGNWANTAKYNPLNTTQDEPGASSINSVGVKSYTSVQQGLQATVETLRNGLYDPIIAALRADKPAAARDAIITSPWSGSSHYGGGADFPTSSAAAAYAKAHSSGGGGGLSLNPITDLGKVGSAIAGIPGDITGAAKDAAGAVVNPVVSDVKNFAIKLAFIGLGLTFVVLGGYQVAKPITDKVKPIAEQAAGAAAVAA